MNRKLVIVVCATVVSGLTLICSNAVLAQDGRPGGASGETNRQPPAGNGPFSGAGQAQGTGGAIVATAITPQEAAKKYPMPNGRYPLRERDPHKASGVVTSPYPPHKEFDCSKIAHGGLVLDTRVNKVFARP